MKTRHWGIATVLLLAVGASTAWAESAWVKSATVDVREGKGAVYPSVMTVAKGQELTVVSRDGKWVQVQAGGKTGWVYETALSSSKVGGDVNFGGGATAEMGTGVAARGLQPGAESYVQSRHLSKAPLEQLIAIRTNISPQEWVTFAAPVNAARR
jgi:uncharacterized protein YraI